MQVTTLIRKEPRLTSITMRVDVTITATSMPRITRRKTVVLRTSRTTTITTVKYALCWPTRHRLLKLP